MTESGLFKHPLRVSPLYRVRLIGSHVCLGFLKCRLGRSSTLCGDLKGSTHRAKETAHLRDIWHDLTVFYRCVELPQKRVVFSQLLVYRDQRWNAGRLSMIHSSSHPCPGLVPPRSRFHSSSGSTMPTARRQSWPLSLGPLGPP